MGHSAPSFASWPLEELRALTRRTYRRGGGSRPDVLLLARDDDQAVLKDHNACDPWFGFWLGALLSWRERRALQRLGSVAGVPELWAPVGRRALLIEWLDAIPAIERAADVAWAQFFPRLEALVDRLHAHGVAHCDLRSPKNILIDSNAEPCVVDFVACFLQGRSWNPVTRWLFKRFCEVDRSAIVKLKRRYAPELLSDADRAMDNLEGPLGRTARRFGVGVRNLSRAMFTRSGDSNSSRGGRKSK